MNMFKKISGSRRKILKCDKQERIYDVVNTIEKENPRYIWFIRAHDPLILTSMEYLEDHFNLIAKKEFVHADVRVFEKKTD